MSRPVAALAARPCRRYDSRREVHGDDDDGRATLGPARLGDRVDTRYLRRRSADSRHPALDGAGDIQFVFGMAATDNLKELADRLPPEAYSFLERPPRYEIKTAPRQQPERVKQQIVRKRGFETIHVLEEMVAEFEYRPVACQKLSGDRRAQAARDGERADAVLRGVSLLLLHHQRPRDPGSERSWFSANDRCDQENLIAQLKSGVTALTMPVDSLVSNWAYMVMASLAWSLKAWLALSLLETARGRQHEAQKQSILQMEFSASSTPSGPALPDRADRTAGGVPPAVLEPLAGRLPAGRGCAAECDVSQSSPAMSGSGCPDPHGPSNQERRQGMEQKDRQCLTGVGASG